jgi:photosystem II stability/assembly factor-like uncharacterized protein
MFLTLFSKDKKISLIFFSSLFLITSYNITAQTGWYPQNTNTTKNIYDIHFNDLNFGYAGCDSVKFLKTTNSGQNWTLYTIAPNTGPGNNFISSIRFINYSTGFACNSVNSYRTTNGGQNWSPIANISANLVFFINENTGWLAYNVSCLGRVYKTSNGGNSWIDLGLSPLWDISNLFFKNESTGFMCGYGYAEYMNVFTPTIFMTTNSGINWNFSYTAPSSLNIETKIRDVFFPDNNIGYAAGTESNSLTPYFYRTSNGGSNWSKQPLSFSIKKIYFSDANTGWGLASGSIRFSSNAGINWINQFNAAAELNDVYMLNSQTGYVCGNGGYIYKTTTGGITPVTPISEVLPDKFELYQNYPNPFNPKTNFKLQIPNSKFDNVKLVIYDVLGKEVETLINEKLEPGIYEVEFDGNNLASGVYYYSLIVGDNIIDTKKMLLLK